MTLRPLATLVASALFVSASSSAFAVCTAGQIDTTFGPNGSNGFVQVSPWLAGGGLPEAMTVAGDNKIYVGATLATDAASSFPYEGVWRSSRAGTMDRTYGGVGVVVPGGQSSPAPAVGPTANLTVDAGGNLLSVNATAAGFSLSRFLPDGTPDTSFGTNGVAQIAVTNPFWFVGIVALADGSVVIGTSSQNPATPSNPFQALFAKFTSSGTPDASFGSGGVVWYVPPGLAPNAQVRMTDIGVLSTGDIVGVGRLRDPAAGPYFQAFAVKIHANGSLDATYGTGGFAITSMGPDNYLFRKMVVQPDDKVVAVGGSQPADFNNITWTPTAQRLNTNGSADAGFGTLGIARMPAGFTAFSGNVTLQANGKIVVATNGTDATQTISFSPIYRLTAVGTLDLAFGTGGSMQVSGGAPLGANPNTVDIRASGTKIFASVSSSLSAAAGAPAAGFLTAIDQGSGAGCR